MESDAKDLTLGHLSINVSPGDRIMVGDNVQIQVMEKKGRNTFKIKIIAPKRVILNYIPRRLVNVQEL